MMIGEVLAEPHQETSAQAADVSDTAPVRRVYVLDDEVQVLEVIAMQLRSAGYEVRTFSRARKFLDVASDLQPGVVVSDQRMPDIDGLRVQQSLRGCDQKFKMILLSGYPETRVAVQAMKHGAVTVLDKPYNKDQLISSLQEAFEMLDRGAIDCAGLPPVLENGGRYLDQLSPREGQVIERVYRGETNKSIGIQLEISIKTVEKHRGKAMKKMQVNSLAELIRLMDREMLR